MTVTEKILAIHAGLEEVKPGQLVQADCDMMLANDITAPIAIQEFYKLGVNRVYDRERIAIGAVISFASSDLQGYQIRTAGAVCTGIRPKDVYFKLL